MPIVNTRKDDINLLYPTAVRKRWLIHNHTLPYLKTETILQFYNALQVAVFAISQIPL